MKLIFITQKLAYNDPLMGFTHPWVEAFAKQVDELVVITNELGDVQLKPKPKIYSLGKEFGNSRFKKTMLLNEILKHESDATAVFCHQCPIYVLSQLPVNPPWKIPVFLWYAHGHLSITARLASFFVRKVFTSTPYALPLYSPKKVVIGQGVDFERWQNPNHVFNQNKIKLVHVGRLSPVKNIIPMIHLTKILNDQLKPTVLDLIGDPATSADNAHVLELKHEAETLGITSSVHFCGGMSHDDIHHFIKDHDYTLNFSTSAAIDKSLIETTAAGLIPISFNPSFLHTLEKTELISNYQIHKSALEVIASFEQFTQKEKIDWHSKLFHIMKSHHDLNGLVDKILKEIKNEIG